MVATASSPLVFASSPTSGYVQYTVTLSGVQIGSNSPNTFTLNESAQPTGQSGFVTIALALFSNEMNFSYSRSMNSSSLPEIFPYLSGLANQSFTYQTQGMSISANIANTGNVQVNFNGTGYQATNYQFAFSATNTTSQKPISATGTLVSMPSGLIYSLQVSISGMNGTTQVTAQLLSTNLSLTAPPNNVNVVGASLVGGGVIAALAIAVPSVLKVKHKNQSDASSTVEKTETPQNSDKPKDSDQEKPSYWVD
jgi:hypothetical protein